MTEIEQFGYIFSANTRKSWLIKRELQYLWLFDGREIRKCHIFPLNNLLPLLRTI